METESLFSASKITVGYRHGAHDAVLFREIDIRLKEGQLVCLMGPNGSGKSTLIRSLAGLQPLLQGALPDRDEKHIAVVLTDRVNSPHMTVEELIAFGRYPHMDWRIAATQKDEEIIRAVAAQAGVSDLMGRKLYELSDGQMQMAMIARALTQETPVLLLDEPTAHLDLNNRLGIMNLLRKLAHEEHKAILVSTHELDLALQTADMIWLTSSGKIKHGIPEDLVLNGSFDDVLQFKGFDLRTGKVQHTPFRNKTIRLDGDGPEYLWTKNALERNGFEVTATGVIKVSVVGRQWKSGTQTFASLAELIDFLT